MVKCSNTFTISLLVFRNFAFFSIGWARGDFHIYTTFLFFHFFLSQGNNITSSDFSKSEKDSLTSTIRDLKTAKIPSTAPVYRSIILHELGWYGRKKTDDCKI